MYLKICITYGDRKDWSKDKNDVTDLVKFCIENTSHRRVFSVNFDWACDVILWLQNSIDQAVLLNKCFIIYRTDSKKLCYM